MTAAPIPALVAVPRHGLLRHPIVERDYARLCSRPLAFYTRTSAALGCSAIVLIAYYAGTESGDSMDSLGRILHLIFSILAMAVALISSLTECANALPIERSAGTLPVLLTAPVPPRSLARGFLVSRMLFALTTLLAVLPLEGLCLLMGGVSGGDLLYTLACVLLAAVWGGAIGLLAGCGSPHVRAATARASMLAGLLLGILPLTLWLAGSVAKEGELPFLPGGGVRWAPGLLFARDAAFLTTPASPLLYIMGKSAGPAFDTTGRWGLFAIPALATAGWVVLAIFAAGLRLRLETELATVGSAGTARIAAMRRFFAGERRGTEAVGSGRAIVGRHPLLWKESREPRNFWLRWGARGAYAGVFVLMGWFSLHPRLQRGPGDSGLYILDFILCMIPWALVFITLPATATFIAEEREKRAFDLLRMAPIPAREFLLARPLGLLRRTAPLLAGCVLWGIVGILRGQVHPLTPVAWFAGTALVYPILVQAFFLRGLTAPSVRVAGRRAGFLLFVLVAGFPLLILMAQLSMDFGGSDRVWKFLALDPLWSAACPLALLGEKPSTYSRDSEFEMLGCLAGVAWFLLAAWLWIRLPRLIADGMHKGDEP